MKRYLSSAQAADYLGMTSDALNAKIRAGKFVEPDVLIGDHFQGWTTATIELARQQLEGDTFWCNADQAAPLITRIRHVAELVRAYGDYRDDKNRLTGIFATVPAELHTIAARLENELRSYLCRDEVSLQTIALCEQRASLQTAKSASPASDVATRTKDVPSWTALTIDFGQVDSLIPAADTDHHTKTANLTDAQNQLDDIIAELPAVLASRGTRLAMLALGTERDKIRDHVAQLPTSSPD